MNIGWKCPICGGCYSPSTPQCFNCTGRYDSASGCKTWTSNNLSFHGAADPDQSKWDSDLMKLEEVPKEE